MATASPWQQPLRGHADVAIVGGGVIGAATAYWIRRLAPDARVLLVEADRVASGASGRNAGFLLLGTHSDYASAVDAYGRERARDIWRFTQQNFYHVAEDLDDGTIGLETGGSVIAAGDAAEADRLRRSHRLLAADGVESQFLDADATASRLGVRAMHGALLVLEGGGVDPVRLVRQLVARSQAQVAEGVRVSGVRRAGAAVELTTDGGTLAADRVLLAAGPRLPHLVPELASRVRPVRAQMLATAPLAPCLPVPVYSHAGFFYLRQLADGRIYLGGARHLHEAAEVGYADATTDELQADLEAYLHRHVAGARDATVERRWSGTMGFSPDGLPTIGDVPGVEGAHYATGFTGHGMGYGVRFGQLAARRLLGRDDELAGLFEERPNPDPAA